jgi:hypothetical protein
VISARTANSAAISFFSYAAQDVHRRRSTGEENRQPSRWRLSVPLFQCRRSRAALNNGSYCDMPRAVRSRVNILLEAFVLDPSGARISFS